MKVKLNPMFEEARGGLGELVFREVRGQTIASRKPTVTGDPSQLQVIHRERFRQATMYGNSVMNNPAVRPLYEAAAQSLGIPVYALAVRDFFNRPTIQSVNLSAYHGQPGDIIEITASDDFGVVNVRVTLTGDQDNLIESGQAVQTAPGSAQWLYTATALNTGDAVTVETVVTDRPGNATVDSRTASV